MIEGYEQAHLTTPEGEERELFWARKSKQAWSMQGSNREEDEKGVTKRRTLTPREQEFVTGLEMKRVGSGSMKRRGSRGAWH